MKWSAQAESALRKVPFFVRHRVRRRVEREASERGRKTIGLKDLQDTRKRYLKTMASEIKGYQLDNCFGPGGCANRANPAEGLADRIETILQRADLLTVLRQQVEGALKYHHEFRISLAECPNACSQPQIKDIGIIGALSPKVSEAPCTGCEACLEACPDNAISLNPSDKRPVIAANRCLQCGKCIRVCPTGTLVEGASGYKVLIGGKLGRHPKLARQLSGLYTEARVCELVKHCCDEYKKHFQKGRRFAELVNPEMLNRLSFIPTK